MRINGLTPHQWRVARMVADGDLDKEIAVALGIEPDGVDRLLARISKRWELDPSKNRRAQITRRFVELSAISDAA